MAGRSRSSLVQGVGEAFGGPADANVLDRQGSSLSKHSGGSKHSKQSQDAKTSAEDSKPKKKKKKKSEQDENDVGVGAEENDEPTIIVPTRLARQSGFFGAEKPEDLLAMGMEVAEAEALVMSPEYVAYVEQQETLLEEQIQKKKHEEERQRLIEAGIDPDAKAQQDDQSSESSHAHIRGEAQAAKGLERALKDCPIRTKFKPDLRRQADKMRNEQHNAELAMEMKYFAKQHKLQEGGLERIDEIPKEQKVGFFRGLYQAGSRQGNVLFNTAKDVASKGGFMKHEVVDETQWQPTVKDAEIQQGMAPGAIKAMRRARDMEAIKDMCAIGRKARQGDSDYHHMAANGQFYCGAMDPAMKKAGVVEDSDSDLSDSFASDDEQLQQDDEESALQTIKSLAERREEFLVKSGGGAVKRRQPQSHDAVFDFAEARICMPRVIPDNHAGQLVLVESDLRYGGTEGDILITTTAPRRHCMAANPNELDVLLDLKKVEEESKKQPDDPTNSLSRHNARAPPSVKDWEAWREIQRQKRIQESQAELQRARAGGGAAGGQKDDDPSAQAETGRIDSKAMAGMKDDRAQNFRRAIRQDHGKGLVVEKVTPPWDARPPPEAEELEELFKEMGIENDELLVLAAGRIPSSDEEEAGELAGPTMDQIEFSVKSCDVRERDPVEFQINVVMHREDVLMPDKLAWSFDEGAENVEGIQDESAFWGDFLLPMPGSTIVEKIRARMDNASAKMRSMFLECQTVVRGNAKPDVDETDKPSETDKPGDQPAQEDE